MEPALNVLIGKTLVKVEATHDEVKFTTSEGKKYRLCHFQNCCEDVVIESISGDLEDLVGVPILEAEEVTSEDLPPPVDRYVDDSYMWTFYKFATIMGRVTIRFFGTSNGYYSEAVDFEEIKE